jgi:hypothetical protein
VMDFERTVFTVRPPLIFVKLGLSTGCTWRLSHSLFLLAMISPCLTLHLDRARARVVANPGLSFYIRRNTIRYTLDRVKMESNTG